MIWRVGVAGAANSTDSESQPEYYGTSVSTNPLLPPRIPVRRSVQTRYYRPQLEFVPSAICTNHCQVVTSSRRRFSLISVESWCCWDRDT
eukprot:2294518-Rhodomonas_salina.4